MIKYYLIRFLAASFAMGSFAAGFILGAKYGLLAGIISFILSLSIGIYLHSIAKNMHQQKQINSEFQGKTK